MKRIVPQQTHRLHTRCITARPQPAATSATTLRSTCARTATRYYSTASCRITRSVVRPLNFHCTASHKPCFNSLSRSFASDASSSPSILIWVDHDNKSLHPSTYNVLTAAKQISPTAAITLLLTGNNLSSALTDAAKSLPVKAILTCTHPSLEHQLPEPLSEVLTTVLKTGGHSHLVVATTTNGRNVLPRVGVALDSQPVTDVTEVRSDDTFVRPIYAGNALCTVQLLEHTKLISIRPTSFDKHTATPTTAATTPPTVSAVDPPPTLTTSSQLSEWVKDELTVSDRPDLSTARVVVSGGRGLKTKENFQLLTQLADVLHGAVGASRAAVDAGMAPNEQQVGQTGKVVAPDLYIAVGISGAIQHLAGMKESKVIVAVNKDGEAPIFQVADYGLVGDLFQILPQMTEKLAKK